VPVGGSVNLEFDAVIELNGGHVNVAEIVGADQIDSDSTPGNNNPGEDDYGSVNLPLKQPQAVPTISVWMLMLMSLMLGLLGSIFRKQRNN